MLQLRADGRIPVAQTVLHGGEFGKLTLPIREDTESLDISVLVEITVVATNKAVIDCRVDLVAIFVPENRIVASLIVFVADIEVEVSPAVFPLDFVFLDGKGRTVVEIALKSDEITETAALECKYVVVQAGQFIVALLTLPLCCPRSHTCCDCGSHRRYSATWLCCQSACLVVSNQAAS